MRNISLKMSKAFKSKLIGNTLRELRENKQLSLKTAAPKANVSYTYLSKIENGHKAPPPALVKKLGELYNADLEELSAQIGDLPADIKEIIEDHGKEAFALLRKTYSKRNKE